MDQVHVVRHKVLVEGRSVRRVAREMGISRNTVRRYVELPEPVRVETATRGRPVRDLVGPRVEALLAESPRWTGGKQRLTATRLHEMLVAEGLTVGVTTVKEMVVEWKRSRREVFVPLVYHPGDLAEVDFFEVLVDVAGGRRKAWMFVMRLMHSGRDFARIYERQDQVSFLDGHVRAFAHFSSVPQRIAYDNLRAAVARILVGSERALTARFEALASHYLFEPCFCRPATGHDKGGVEARGKGIRWQHLVPIPSEASLDAINVKLLARLDARLTEKRDSDGKTISDRFAVEHAKMLPLAAVPFRARATHSVGVSRSSLVIVEGAYYSVPCDWNGLDVMAHVGPGDVEITGPNQTVLHPRKRPGGKSIDYRHYVRDLARKPQAVRQVAAELVRDLGAPFPSAWRALVDAHGPKQAARIFAKVLGHIETRGIVAVAITVEEALLRSEPLLLALAPPSDAPPSLPCHELPQSLRAVCVESGRAADYDALLTGGVR
ncbi:MAG TPA: IS21 family transposase [Steroidobacteraceae bacterium]|jgi:transposase